MSSDAGIAVELMAYAESYDQRLGQFIVNCVPTNKDIFYVSNVELLEYARAYFKTHGRWKYADEKS